MILSINWSENQEDNLVIFIHDTPSLTSEKGTQGNDKCSDLGKWCYKFTKIEMTESKQDSQVNLNINLQVQDDLGSEPEGYVDVYMTVTPSNSEKPYDPKRIDITKGEPRKIPFDVPLSTKGDYSLLFELRSPVNNDDPYHHTFHTYTIDFDFP